MTPKRKATKHEEDVSAEQLPAEEPEDEEQPEDEPESEEEKQPQGLSELDIKIKPHFIEIRIPRDGQEADTLNRVADLVDGL